MMRRILLFVIVGLVSVQISLADNGGEDPKKFKSSIPEYLYPGTFSLKKEKAQPDVPGSLVIEFGMTFLNQKPESMRINQWGSWTINLYYMYEFVIGQSPFSFNIGPGVGIERLRFFDDVTVSTIQGDEFTIVEPVTNLIPNASEVRRSILEAVYIDVPLEVRWHLNKYDFKRTFKIGLGGKIGYRIDSKTKVVYTEFNQKKKLKSKENYNLTNFRYGVYGRIGWRGIGLFYYHNLTPLFQNNKGPEFTDAFNSVFGLSLSGF